MAVDNRNELDILIEAGADFALSFTIEDDNDNVVDLTGATVAAQLRQFAEATDSFDFTVSHNGSGGRVKIGMPHEMTVKIPYSSGVWDVFITFPDGTVVNPIYGDVYIQPRATRPYSGTVMQMIFVRTASALPSIGQNNLLYFVADETAIYRWTGAGYTTSIDTGISSIELIENAGNAKTYRIHYGNGNSFDFTVNDGSGVGISSIELTGSSGLVDTYTIYFTDGNSTTFNVTNGDHGPGIARIEKTGTSGLVDTYTITTEDGQEFEFEVTNGEDGAGVGTVTSITLIAGNGISLDTDNTAITSSGSRTISAKFPTSGTPAALGTASNGSSNDVARADHVHEKPTYGNISASGTVTTNVSIANGDKLVVTDASNSHKVARTSVEFDGSSSDKVLSKAGTFVSLPSITISDTDLTEGVSELATGALYFYYESEGE